MALVMLTLAVVSVAVGEASADGVVDPVDDVTNPQQLEEHMWEEEAPARSTTELLNAEPSTLTVSSTTIHKICVVTSFTLMNACFFLG